MNVKFTLTKEKQIYFGITLFRIKSKKDFADVKKNDLGGWVETAENLESSGDAWVSGNARVSGDARVSGNALVYGDARVSGNALVYGNARVSGNALVYGNARVYGDALVSGNAQVSGNALVYGDARVYGNAQVYGNALVYGDARVYGDALVYGNAQVEKSPLLIQGTKHTITAINGKIKIGCEEHTIAMWLKNYAKIGEKHLYTDEQINEYHKYILLCAELAKAEGKS